MGDVLVVKQFELLEVAGLVEFVRAAHRFVYSFLFSAHSLAGFHGMDLQDCRVEPADGPVCVFGDGTLFCLELPTQFVHSFFKFVHFACFSLALQAGRKKTAAISRRQTKTRLVSEEQKL